MNREWIRRSAAEFVIIVVGVLVALSIDQFVASRADLESEEVYLESLIRDVTSDLAELDSIDAWSERRELRNAMVLDFLRGQAEPPADSLLVAIQFSVRQWPVSVATYTVDELRSTGSLRLIRDPNVRRAIAEYYKSWETNSVVFDELRDRIWDNLAAEIQPQLLTAEDRVLASRLSAFVADVPAGPFSPEHTAPSIADLRSRFAGIPAAEAAFDDALFVSRITRSVVVDMRRTAVSFREELQHYRDDLLN